MSRSRAGFRGLRRRGKLGDDAWDELEETLLLADVGMPTTTALIEQVKERAAAAKVRDAEALPGLLEDAIVDLLTPDADRSLARAASGPTVWVVTGVNGVGKTTTIAKIAAQELADGRTALMAAADTFRAAAADQLAHWADELGVDVVRTQEGGDPGAVAFDAVQAAIARGVDVVLVDTAGRLHIDDELMQELVAIRQAVGPSDLLYVADAMTGQDAVNSARAFHERLEVDGVILTKLDGDARGGAALSMRAVTGRPIKLMGVGEKLDALEPFHGDRIARRILGMGDVVSLVEKAAETIEREEAEKLAAKLAKGRFDLDDLLGQIRQLKKMGGLSGLLGLLPGIGKIKKQMAEANIDESVLKRQEAIILSMTPKERRNPDLIQASRKRRIAAGSGTEVQDVNRLLKQFMDMQRMMKQAKKMGAKFGAGGAMPTPEQLQQLQNLQSGQGLPKLPPGFPRNFKF